MKKALQTAGWTLAALLLTVPLAADHHVNTTEGLMMEGGALALRGYDPVAYFNKGEAVDGSHLYSAKHNGAVYQFSTEANKEAFEKNPEKYVPAYGGFCAMGVVMGQKLDGDPEVWKVVDDRLYLNINPDVQKKWEAKAENHIKTADKKWEEIASAAPESLAK